MESTAKRFSLYPIHTTLRPDGICLCLTDSELCPHPPLTGIACGRVLEGLVGLLESMVRVRDTLWFAKWEDEKEKKGQ